MKKVIHLIVDDGAFFEVHEHFAQNLVVGFARLGEPPATIARAAPGAGPVAAYATRLPSGHPEGYLEAFAQLYRDFAEQLWARIEKRTPDPRALLVPTVQDGLRGVAFIAAAIQSSRSDGAWTAISSP